MLSRRQFADRPGAGWASAAIWVPARARMRTATLRASMLVAPVAFPRHATIFRTAGLFSATNTAGRTIGGINQAGAFGSLQAEGVQYGYNFKNAPVSVYAGFDTLELPQFRHRRRFFRPSTSRPARRPAMACMRASKSSRRRIFKLPVAWGRLYPAVGALRYRQQIALAVQRFSRLTSSAAGADADFAGEPCSGGISHFGHCRFTGSPAFCRGRAFARPLDFAPKI